MAQQTQAGRAADAWTAFMARFPTPESLAASTPAEVIRAWRGLGYNRRAVALRDAAIQIVRAHGGHVPPDQAALEALPGVGPYTARAVRAIAFDRHVAPLDTNVRRVLGRWLGVDGRPRAVADERALQAAADALVPAGDGEAGRWAHALMDLGAGPCRVRAPRCDDCPALPWCEFGASAARAGMEPPARRRDGGASGGNTPFPATTRWLRGRILDALRDAADGAWVVFEAPIGDHPAASVHRQLGRLALDGLVELSPGDASRARLRSLP